MVDGAETAPLLAEADYPDRRGASPTSTASSPTSASSASSPSRSRRWAPTWPCSRPRGWPSASACPGFRCGPPRPSPTSAGCAPRSRRPASRRRGGREVASARRCRPAASELGLPAVLKPVDGSGQRGVSEVRTEGELAPAFERALAGFPHRRGRARALRRGRRADRQRLPARRRLLPDERHPAAPAPAAAARGLHRAPLPVRASRPSSERELFELAHRGQPRGRDRDRPVVCPAAARGRAAVGDRGRRAGSAAARTRSWPSS